MMKRMNTGGVQYMELQPCNEQEEYELRNYTNKVMPFEHYGESETPHEWEDKRNRTTLLLYRRLWLQRVSCVLVVLWQLFMSSLFLCCAAADNPFGILTNITHCFPNVLLNPSGPMYYCEVENPDALRGFNLWVGYYNDKPISVWEGFLSKENLIEFQPNSPLPLGDPKVLILQPGAPPLFINVKLTNQFPMTYMNLQDTSASLTSKPAYYGLRATIQTNFPDTSATLHHLLRSPQSDSEGIATSCTAAAGCHNLTTSPFLPVPWVYSLCLGTNGWQGHYLPWGTSLLDVGVLVSTPLYINSSGSEKFLHQDAVTGAIVTDMKRVFLVRCPDNVCPNVTLNNGEGAVSVAVCTGSGQDDRVYLPTEGGSFSATSGVYAVCVDFVAAVGISPAALPVTVLQDPFVFNGTAITSTMVRIAVSGGDLSWRQEPYKVCAMPPDTPCESVATAKDAVCVESESKNSSFVDVDISNLSSKYGQRANVTFCFVPSDVTFNGRPFVWSRNVNVTFLPDDSAVVKPKSSKCSLGVIIGIVCGAVAAIVMVVVIVCCVRQRRRQQKEKEGPMYSERSQIPSRGDSTRPSDDNMGTDSTRGMDNNPMRSDSTRPSDDNMGTDSVRGMDNNPMRGDDFRPQYDDYPAYGVNPRGDDYYFNNQFGRNYVVEEEMMHRPSHPRYSMDAHNVPPHRNGGNYYGRGYERGSFQGDDGDEGGMGYMRGNSGRYSSRARAHNDTC